MGAYTCQFGVVHKRCRCREEHTIDCDEPLLHEKKKVLELQEGKPLDHPVTVGDVVPAKEPVTTTDKTNLNRPVSTDNPSHYRSDTVECIEVVRHASFDLGNAIKYLWRLGKKDIELNELKKAYWYLEDELTRLGPNQGPSVMESVHPEDWGRKYEEYFTSIDGNTTIHYLIMQAVVKKNRDYLVRASSALHMMVLAKESEQL